MPGIEIEVRKLRLRVQVSYLPKDTAALIGEQNAVGDLSFGCCFLLYACFEIFLWVLMSDDKKMMVSRATVRGRRQNIGESILYLWVEKIRDVLIQKSQMTEPGPDVKKKTEEEDIECGDDLILACQPENPVKALDFDVSENRTEIEELPPIDHGIPITDRRSTFQAHLAPVVCPKQVKMVLAKLYENKKIASATHNIYAYRIYCEDKQTFLQDCEDDGETAAGGRLLHLMEILNVRNVMVVVSRWYGGILLGPDRFKHINNCARNILVEKNYTSSPEESSKTLGKNKKVRKDKKRSEH
ncbi:protein IMPACT isoform X2 [Delphinapterus leucas]|uniref:Protein IMPACT isoform X2 n=1 Tax=Delphinapterus leucas TaxID=9749 RepID=A0A2Y9PIT8_DELLE|nr:protein IMPACT isoform X2 [Delphinapterus leucas]